MTSTIPSIAYAWKEISRFAADNRQHFIALLELITYIKKHPTLLFIGCDGGLSSLRSVTRTRTISKFRLPTTGFIVFGLAWASRTQRNPARFVGESEFSRSLAVRRRCSVCVYSKRPISAIVDGSKRCSEGQRRCRACSSHFSSER